MKGSLKKWIFSLEGKFIIVATICILIFTTIGSLVIISREETLYRQDMFNQGKVFAEISRLMLTNVMVYNELGIMDKQDLVDYLDYFILNLMERDKRVRYVMVVDNKGWVLAHSSIAETGKIYMDRAIEESIREIKTDISYNRVGDDLVLQITSPLNIGTKRWGVLRLGISTKEVQKNINVLKNEILTLVIIFSIISLLIISIGANILSRPVKRLSKIMDGIKTHGDLEQQFKLRDRRDELGELQQSFLWMIQRLREADREHKKTIEVLAQTEKMVSIGRLASGVAHEINNPLGGITLCFKKLMNTEVTGQSRERLIQAINDGLQKIKNIVVQLLDFSRMTVTEKAPVNINNLINRILLLLDFSASKKRIKIVSDLSDDVPEVLIDENKMSQVFMNIIINSIQSMDENGTMTIRTSADNGYCMVSIEDTGAGIPPDVMPRIFDPFFTTKGIGEGTGLGLSVSRGIIEQHGGVIEVDSQEGVGTTFWVKLPIHDA